MIFINTVLVTVNIVGKTVGTEETYNMITAKRLVVTVVLWKQDQFVIS